VVAFSTQFNGVYNTKILDLVITNAIYKKKGFFLFVGFDAADKVEIGVG
jgi:hypothetical protein